MCTLHCSATERQTDFFWKGQKICTGFNQEIVLQLAGKLCMRGVGFFSACCRKMLPRSLSECLLALNAVNAG